MKHPVAKVLSGCAVIFLLLFAGLEFILWYNYRAMHGPDAKCRALIAGFAAGLKAYKDEYGSFPADALTSTDSHALHRTRGKIMETLHPDRTKPADKPNLRRIDFYDPPPAKNGVNGMYFDEHHEPVLVDPWGEPLYFEVDLTAQLQVPDPGNPGHFIPTDVIVFSAGPDHDPNTWDDNVASWR